MSKKTFYVTTPIYYPSGNLHIGHAYTTTLAWTLANYKKMMGYDVKFLTGADEHGLKIENKANQAGIEPQQYVDEMSSKFKSLWETMDIKYDYFSRTSNKNHISSIQKQITELFEKDIIYKGKYKGLYSIEDEEFLTKSQAIEKDGIFYHPSSDHVLEEVSEDSYFFRMNKFEEWISNYFKDNPDFIFPKKIINELNNSFLKKGLPDLSISRSTFKWGIPLLEDDKHILYVWLDALNNYITALGYNSDDNADYLKYWVNGDEIVHIVGKEITRFHGIYWPIILKSLDLRLPTKILSHGWIITPEGKMSKSKGNVIDPIYLIEKYGNETLKYFLASQIAIGQDRSFEENSFIDVYNSELANNYGNLVSRTIAMCLQNFDEPIQFKESSNEVHVNILKSISNRFENYKIKFDDFKVSEAIQEAMLLGKELNGYIDITSPWTLTNNKEELSIVLNSLLNGIYCMSLMLSVVLPNKVKIVQESFGKIKLIPSLVNNFKKFNDINITKNKTLFERIK